MNMKQFFQKKGLDLKSIICLSVLIVSIAIGILVLNQTNSRFTETMESHNMGILDSYAGIIEQQLQEAVMFNYDLRTDLLVNDLIQSAEISGPQQLKIVQMLERLPEKLAKYPIVDNFFIYFSTVEKVLTSTGFYDAQLYYQAHFQYDGTTYETWRKLLEAVDEQGIYITHNQGILPRADEAKYTVYARRTQSSEDSYMTNVILMSNETLKDRCIGKAITGEGRIGLYAEEGDVIVEAAPGAVSYNASLGSFTAGAGISVLTVKELPHFHMTLVLAMPDTIFTSVLWNAYMTLRNVIMLMIVLAAVSGTFFVYVYYVRPRKNLVEWIREKKPENTPDNGEGYAYIRNSLDQMLTAHEREIERERAVGQRLLGENYLMNLLLGKEQAPQKLRETLKSYCFDLPWPYVWILVYESHIADLPRYRNIQKELEGILRQGLPVRYEAVFLNKSERRNILILNLEEKITEEAIEKLRSTLRQWTRQAQLESFYISMGSQETLEEMARSYATAEETAEYHFLYPDRTVLQYSLIQRHTDKYTYPLETENELIQQAVQNQLESVEEILHQIFQRNFEKRALQIQFAKLLLYALLNTVYKVETIKKSEERLLYQVPPDRLIMSSGDVNEAKEQIEFIFRSLCEDNEEQQIQDASWRMKRIIRYIQDHCLENDLSLEQIADHFRITPQYLSGLFKKSLNKNFSSYITGLRLENAFSLMKNPKLTLTEIAMRSGFTNYLALARAFQKYENQTPGEYRRTHYET